MSSTGRSDVRVSKDFYPTPQWATELILLHESFDNPVLEPACGDGAILDVLHKKGYSIVRGSDIRSEGISEHGVGGIDFLQHDKIEECHDLIPNPPFGLAQEFIEKSLDTVSGKVILLLRLSMLESRKRYDLWQKHPASRIYVLSERPSFVGGKTDSCAYAWFVWDRNSSDKMLVQVISKKELEVCNDCEGL